MWVPAPVCLCVLEVFIFIHNLAFLLIPYLHSLITACSSNRGSVCLSVSHIEALGPLNIPSTRHGCFATNECDKSPPRVASLYVPHTYRTASPQQMSPLFCRVCREKGGSCIFSRGKKALWIDRSPEKSESLINLVVLDYARNLENKEDT